MDDNAPVTLPLITELKSLFLEGCNAHAERDALKTKSAGVMSNAQKAAKQATDLIATLNQIASP